MFVIYFVIVLTESLQLISKVAAHVNESIRQVDNFKKLIDVQKKLVGDTGDGLISPSRVSNINHFIVHSVPSMSSFLLCRNYCEKGNC